MDVVSTCPLRVASLEWQPFPRVWALTVVCKATFRLEPGTCELAEEQEDPVEDDGYWDDDEAKSLYASSDLVPFKARADVLLVGHAFAPRGQPARTLMARLAVGGVDKKVEVWCDRIFWHHGQVLEGAPFTKMPLRYERAAGGPATSNPVGLRFDAPPDSHGAVRIPNLQPPGQYVSQRGNEFGPIGFGPIAPGWPDRVEKLSQEAAGWSPRGWTARPLPKGFDHAYFNAAPRDQQVASLRPDERLVMENLHPDYTRLETSLPGLRPRAVVTGGGRVEEEIPLTCDTLWIDTDRAVATLVWRGRVSLSHPREAGQVVVSMAGPGALAAAAAPTPNSRGALGGDTIAVPGTESEEGATHALDSSGPGWLQARPAATPWSVSPTTPDAGPAGPTLPFAPARSPWEGFEAAPPLSPNVGVHENTGTVAGTMSPTRDVLPFGAAPPPVDRSTAEPGVDPVSSIRGPTRAPTQEGAIAFEPLREIAVSSPPLDAQGAMTGPQVESISAPPPMIGPLATPEMVASASGQQEAVAIRAVENASTKAAVAETPEPKPTALDFPLERCAVITASIARSPAESARILEENELTKELWADIERRWADAIREEITRSKANLLKRFDAAYVEQLENERGVIQVSEYAQLIVAAERGTTAAALAALTLPSGAVMRIERVWVGKIASDAGLGRSVKRAVIKAREAS